MRTVLCFHTLFNQHSLPVKMAPPARNPRRLNFALLVSSAALALGIVYILLSVRSTVCLSDNPNCYRGFLSEYSFDASLSQRAEWMKEIPDETNITSMSIPGTHDTMTYDIHSQRLECQNWNLTVQMEAGLRYFDIRARLRDDELRIYHSSGDTGFSYENVILGMCDFLEDHPSETIVMRLKEEGGPLGANTVTFEGAFNSYRTSKPSTKACINDHFYLYDPADPIPSLGQLRSKILILQNFKAKEGPYGLAWAGPRMKLEDFWIMPDLSFLADKWEAIRKAVQLANGAPFDNEVLYVAHVSASVGVLPIEAAAGPLDRSVTGMNDMTGEWLEDHVSDARRTGIVIFDFPGKRAIDAVLSWNKG